MESQGMFTMLLVLMASVTAGVNAQDMCTSPSMAPADEQSIVTSTPGRFFLYPEPFDSSCVGRVVDFEYCYVLVRTSGTRENVFTLVILEDMGDSYRVATMETIREDRGSCNQEGTINGVNRCCQTGLLSTPVDVTTSYAYGFVTQGVENQLLVLDSSDPIAGYELDSIMFTTGEDISETDLGIDSISLSPIPLRSLRFIIQPAEDLVMPLLPTISTTPGAVNTQRPSSTPGTSPPDTSGSGKDTDNAGAIAAGIIVPLVVLSAVAVVVVVVLVLVVRRRRYRKEELMKGAETTPGYTNQLYGGDSIRFNNPSGYVTATSHQKSPINNTEGEYEFEEPHDYAVPDNPQGGPDEYVEAYPAPHAALGLPRAQNSFVHTELPDEYVPPEPSPYIVPTTDRERSSTTPSTVWPGQIDPYADPFETASNRSGSLTVVRHTSSTLKRESEDIYEVPATEETALYEQMKRIDIAHIQRSSLKLMDHLGSGQFGTVSKGEWQSPEGLVEVAVKMLKPGSDHMDKIKFLQEAAMVGQFNHHNVVKLYGMVVSGEPKMMVLELLSKGDLREHLLSLRPEKINEVDEELPHTLLSYCRQIASGMSHLAMKAFVHRDLAARNVLVSEDGTCKIADFGMSRDLMNESYYVSHGGKIPVKWTAPEALQYKKYSTASDVWSFGAVVYEIWSLGHKPFEGYSNGQAMSMVDSGVRLPPPPGCPRAIYELMIKCWHPKSSERPDSGTIVQSLSRSDMKLLKWSEEDKGVHPEASRLGAELEVAVELYKDLQDSYLNYSQEE